MLRFALIPAAFVLVASGPAPAHFLYLVPQTGSASAVFSLDSKPDPNCDPTILGLKSARAGQEKVAVEAPDRGVQKIASGAATLFATADFGVSNRGEGNAVLVRYHAKCQPTTDENAVGQALEITPRTTSEGLAFAVTFQGKPLASAEVTVFEPDSTKPLALKTDPQGLTANLSATGQYAVRAIQIEKVNGDFEGRRYSSSQHCATVVTTKGKCVGYFLVAQAFLPVLLQDHRLECLCHQKANPSPHIQFPFEIDAGRFQDVLLHGIHQLQNVFRRGAGVGDGVIRVAVVDLGPADAVLH